jgi:N-acetylmuramoyl-L-alanine amidase
MRKKGLFIVSIFTMCLISLFTYTSAFAEEQKVNSDESSYYSIHYNGDVQEITISDTVTLKLNGWTNESKESVKGSLNIKIDSSVQVKDITIDVTDEVNELLVTENHSIHYKLIKSDSFSFEVKPLEVNVVNEPSQSSSVISEKPVEVTKEVPVAEVKKEAPVVNVQKEAVEAVPSIIVPQQQSITTFSTQSVVENPSVNYTTHIQDIGWQKIVSNGKISGTQGQAKRLESIKISIGNIEGLGVKYTTHVQGYGWLNYVSNGALSGTTGEAKRLEAIKIELTGAKAANYEIHYRVHAQDHGWMKWVKDGQVSGTTGEAKRLEAIEIKIVKKETAPASSSSNNSTPTETNVPNTPVTKVPSVVYTTHVQDYGWLTDVMNGKMSGTVGKAKRLEAIKINLKNNPYGGRITYTTHVQDYGWLNNVFNGQLSGTEGKAKRLEAITINLTGEIAKHYDVYYRVHAQDYGWLGWAKNGMKSGTAGRSKRLEGIEIKLVAKGKGQAVNATTAFIQAKTVFIDPGHGGTDPGATSGGQYEANLNLAVAKKVQSLLMQRGYTVYMSRDNNTTVSLLDRAQMANGINPEIFVSIHHNAGGASGIESIYYQYHPDYPSKINSSMHNNPDRINKSKTLAGLIQDNLIQYTGATNRGIYGSALAVLRETAMPSTLLELGFIDNGQERQRLVTDSYQNKLALAIADGIDDYFNVY